MLFSTQSFETLLESPMSVTNQNTTNPLLSNTSRCPTPTIQPPKISLISNPSLDFTNCPKPDPFNQPRDAQAMRRALKINHSNPLNPHLVNPICPYYVELPSEDESKEDTGETKEARLMAKGMSKTKGNSENEKQDGELALDFVAKLSLKRARVWPAEDSEDLVSANVKRSKVESLNTDPENLVPFVSGLAFHGALKGENSFRGKKSDKLGNKRIKRGRREVLADLNGNNLREVPIKFLDGIAFESKISDTQGKGSGGWPQTATRHQ